VSSRGVQPAERAPPGVASPRARRRSGSEGSV